MKKFIITVSILLSLSIIVASQDIKFNTSDDTSINQDSNQDIQTIKQVSSNAEFTHFQPQPHAYIHQSQDSSEVLEHRHRGHHGHHGHHGRHGNHGHHGYGHHKRNGHHRGYGHHHHEPHAHHGQQSNYVPRNGYRNFANSHQDWKHHQTYQQSNNQSSFRHGQYFRNSTLENKKYNYIRNFGETLLGLKDSALRFISSVMNKENKDKTLDLLLNSTIVQNLLGKNKEKNSSLAEIQY